MGDPIRTLPLVGVTGFEPATFWSRTKRATKLRYTPTETYQVYTKRAVLSNKKYALPIFSFYLI